MTWNDKYVLLRDALELLYFASAIALVAIAAKGLKQINIGLEQLKLTKGIAEKAARRDAYRLAHEQCQSFGTVIGFKAIDMVNAIRAGGLTAYEGHTFSIEDGAIVKHDFKLQDMMVAVARVDPTAALNMLEGFAMFFVTGLADEEIGYRETAIAFCELSAFFMPAFWYYREKRRAMYKSTIELYEMWNGRLELEKLKQKQQDVERDLTRVKSRTIKPIGTE